jgi:hypothetical protein
MTPVVVPLEQLEPVVLEKGSHSSRDRGMCVMEAVAWVAGEPHTDQPVCACPVISAFLRSWNDAIPDDDTRTRLLKPLVPKLVDTKASKAVERRRADLALDWMVRVQTPAWLELAKLPAEAAALRALAPLLDRSAVVAAGAALNTARERAARDAAWDAAWDAARAAAWAAARDAARAAARDAAWAAAWDAARDAAWDAARAAARAAAWDAARAAAWDRFATELERRVAALEVPL